VTGLVRHRPDRHDLVAETPGRATQRALDGVVVDLDELARYRTAAGILARRLGDVARAAVPEAHLKPVRPHAKVPHAPSTVGCRKVTKSTTPSSSPELGSPSGPSLSNCAQTVSPPGRFEIESSAVMSICPNRWPLLGQEFTTPMPLQPSSK
jgi:hypothetical protein